MENKVDIKKINEKIEKESAFVDLLRSEMNKVIVGQKNMIDKLLIGLLAKGHILLEGVPGLAKTLAINTLSKAISGSFSRIQFTPDLLPADVVGTQLYNVKQSKFSVKKGPVFANFVLADEINRAPAKVQSALLEAMQEKQVTIGEETFMLDEPFLVMATQNPIDQEGTYPLPEAQVDRFMLKTVISYPELEDEKLMDPLEVDALTKNLRQSFEELMKVAPNLTEEHSGMLKNIQKPNRLTDRAISVITISNQEKQEILEELNIKTRIERPLT